ncbi:MULTISPECIES: DUF998 domain-containing protein [Micromonospora]|uniref:DUF998 domain-containing protein n=1 Tax=Micromonospora yangpuensis TaxID=683228 RepID=A0A1C6UBX4_9ACTN|nr:DUF998 domain-containing protein [Micromonospora yangpuensis]GGM29676.1 hypothetical protein GCM10012279_55540 [Micromonospora yangpuensis]SCL51595.1 Protein of unknown function [Micromonospora yangpuensis]
MVSTAPRARPAQDLTARVAASAAAGCTVAGVVAVTVAVVAGPGPGLTGYVSEAGIAGSGYAPTFRIGIFALAAALLLLAVALPRRLRPAAGLLVAGSVCTLLSGAVTCSEGCPLPPFERATVADLVHGVAAVVATACVVFAMAAVVWFARAEVTLRRLATAAVVLALPLAGAVGLAMITLGRGAVVGVLERVLLGVAAGWALATATAVALRRPTSRLGA